MERLEHLESFVDYGQAEDYAPPCEADDALDDGDQEVLDGFGYAPAPEVLPAAERDDDAASPEERIGRLFDSMPPHRLMLAGILDLCDQPASCEAVEAFVRQRATHRNAVFNAATYLRMLAEAGAVEKVVEDGTPYGEVDLAPVEVERDGRRYLEPAEPPAEFWRATDAGAQAASQYRPEGLIGGLFRDRGELVPVFKKVLGLCDRPGGASIGEIRDQVNGDPILVQAKKTAQFLIDYLERSGAITYAGGWVTTADGCAALEGLEAKEG